MNQQEWDLLCYKNEFSKHSVKIPFLDIDILGGVFFKFAVVDSVKTAENKLSDAFFANRFIDDEILGFCGRMLFYDHSLIQHESHYIFVRNESYKPLDMYNKTPEFGHYIWNRNLFNLLGGTEKIKSIFPGALDDTESFAIFFGLSALKFNGLLTKNRIFYHRDSKNPLQMLILLHLI